MSKCCVVFFRCNGVRMLCGCWGEVAVSKCCVLIGRYRVLVFCGFWEARCLSALSLVGGAMSICCVSDRRHSVWRVFLVEASVSVFQRRIEAMEMRYYLKILCISYKDHVTNEQVRAKIQQAIRPHEDLLTIVKRHKLQWYGHVSR